jgi:hypothetical protein
METDGGAMAYLVGVLGAIFGGTAAGGTLLLRQRKRNGQDRTGEILMQLQAIETILREAHTEGLRRSDAHFERLDKLQGEIAHLSGYVEAKLS